MEPAWANQWRVAPLDGDDWRYGRIAIGCHSCCLDASQRTDGRVMIVKFGPAALKDQHVGVMDPQQRVAQGSQRSATVVSAAVVFMPLLLYDLQVKVIKESVRMPE